MDTRREAAIAKTETNSLITSFIDGLITIRAMKKQDYMLQKFFLATDAFSDAIFSHYSTHHWFGLFSSLTVTLAICASLFLLAVRVDEHVDFMVPATFYAACTLTTFFYGLCLHFNEMEVILVSAQRIEKLLTSIGQEEATSKKKKTPP